MARDATSLEIRGAEKDAISHEGLPAPSPGLVVLFYYLGMCTLLVWNAILSFMAVFVHGLCNDVEWLGEGWGSWSARLFSVAINIIFALSASRKVTDNVSISFRLHFGCILNGLGALGLMFCDLFLRDGADPNHAMAIALVFIVLVGAGGSFMQGAVFGLAGAIGPRVMSAVMVGQGLAGVLTGLIGVPCGDSRIAMATSHILLTLLVFAVTPIICCCGAGENVLLKASLQPPVKPANDRAQRLTNADAQARQLEPSSRSAPALMVHAWPMVSTVFFVFLFTFLVFPSVTVMWQPMEHIKLVMATFQFMDVAGRMLAEVDRFNIKSQRKVQILAAMRLFFVPLFMAVQRGQGEWARSLAIKVPLMAMFALTNGYVSTLAMMLGPVQQGIQQHERARVGTLLGFGTVHGIFWGSMLSALTQIGL